MDRAEQESWRAKVRLCAVAIGLHPISPYGDMGWLVKDSPNAKLEFFYYPLASDTQAAQLVKVFDLTVRGAGGRWRARKLNDMFGGEWQRGWNMAIVDYVAAHPELHRRLMVRKSTPTRGPE